MKIQIENLKAQMRGVQLNSYQRALALDEYYKLLDYVEELEQLTIPLVVGRSEQLVCHTCKNLMPENQGGNCCSKCWNEKYGAK
jgi:hypothetical protein